MDAKHQPQALESKSEGILTPKQNPENKKSSLYALWATAIESKPIVFNLGDGWNLDTKSNWGPVSGLCGYRLHFSTDFHSLAIIANASPPFFATPLSTNQQPITIPVRLIPP
jgi:hypothetical protein